MNYFDYYYCLFGFQLNSNVAKNKVVNCSAIILNLTIILISKLLQTRRTFWLLRNADYFMLVAVAVVHSSFFYFSFFSLFYNQVIKGTWMFNKMIISRNERLISFFSFSFFVTFQLASKRSREHRVLMFSFELITWA